ncbi:MAG: DUF4129 domain-containing protein [Armatimonadota bacterium]
MPSASERQAVAPVGHAGPERPPLPSFDWLTEVAIPACVFGLLSSLLYYLIEVRSTLAGAESVGPLRWVVFWFLLACIGIARIRTKYGGAAIAGYYSALLAGAIFLFVWVYTGRAGAFYGGAGGGQLMALIFNWALVVVVWWAAHAVTREATLEENVETQLEGGLWTLLAEEWKYPDAEEREPDAQVDHAKVRPRHPGRLVLWLSLAALVLFAVGQRTIGSEGTHARTAFWCMSLYVLFALLLLALTNLSALRMQVRRRGISLAPAVSPAWMITSTLVVIAIVLFSALMPRSPTPAGEPRYVQVPQWLTDSQRPGVQRGPAQGLGPEGRAPGEGKHEGPSPEEGGEQPGPGQDEGERGGRRGEDEGEGGGIGRSLAWTQGEGQGRGRGEGQGEGEGREAQSGDGEQPQFGGQLPDLARLLLWLLLLAAAIATVYFVWMHRQAVREALRALWRLPGYLAQALLHVLDRVAAWLGRLGLPAWGLRRRIGNLPDDPFVDIFARGLDADLPAAEVIRYVYRAFQVYAARGGCERRDDQTALEFLRALPPHLYLPDRAEERLTRAYVLATYSPHEVSAAQVRGARQTWELLRERLDEIAARGEGPGAIRNRKGER